MKRASLNSVFQLLATFLLLSGVVLTCFPKLFSITKSLNNYAVPIMLAYLILGISLVFLRQQRLMFISFGCCALLCLYLKRLDTPLSFQPLPKKEKRLNPKFSFAHFNLGVSSAKTSILQGIRAAEADIISIQEIRLDCLQALKDSLKTEYSFEYTEVDTRMFGTVFLSKKRVKWFKNLEFDDLSNPIGCIQIKENQMVSFASINTFPALTPASSARFSEHLQKISEFVHQQNGPVIIAGDFNAVPWSKELKIFEEESGLKSSRRGFMGAIKGKDFFNLPLSHLFYSSNLHCHHFEPLSFSDASFTGVKGIFSIKKTPKKQPNVEKSSE